MGIKGTHHSEEWKKMMSERNKGVNNPYYGRKHSEETRKKLRESHKGQIPWCAGMKLTDEHKRNLSLSHKGKTPWNKGKKMSSIPSMQGKSTWMKGKHHTLEANEKNRLAHLGKPAWNKGKKFIGTPEYHEPWNKGRHIQTNTGRTHITKEKRATQIFPIKNSLPEVKLHGFLNQLNIVFVPHKYMHMIAHKYQCDIFIPSMNLVIECDGDYWHGNTSIPKFQHLNQWQIKAKEKDSLRTNELIEKGYKVLRLWESDIGKMTLEDFKQRLIIKTSGSNVISSS